MSDDKLSALRKAVDAKGAYWTAVRELELILGYEDVPDNVSDYIVDQLDNLASSCDSSAWIDDNELTTFLNGIPDDTY